MSEYRTEAEAIAQITYDAAIPDQLDPGAIYSAPTSGGDIHVFTTDILDAAFEHVTKQIEEETGHQIWHTT